MNVKEEENKNTQKFYFTEEGKLVVESNKGVWVDGEQFVKMYGYFSCNARTMGIIINKLKNIPVEVGKYIRDAIPLCLTNFPCYETETNLNYCVLGCSKERVEEYEKELAKQNFTNKKIEKSEAKKEAAEQDVKRLVEEINKFNDLPWYKRIFKKISI